MANVAYRPIERPVAADTEPRPSPVERAYSILYFGFIVLPVVAGLDKFSDHLVDWDSTSRLSSPAGWVLSLPTS